MRTHHYNRFQLASILLFPLLLVSRNGKKLSLSLLLILALGISGCFTYYFRTHTQPSIDRAEMMRLIQLQKDFILHANGTVYMLKEVRVINDTLHAIPGTVPEWHQKHLNPNTNKTNNVKRLDRANTLAEVHLYYPGNIDSTEENIAIPLHSFERADIYTIDQSTTNTNHVISAVGLSLAVIGGFTLIAFLIACNCPQVYAENQGQYQFTCGMYSGAIYSNLERTDYIPLGPSAGTDQPLLFQLRNVADEEQYINQVSLIEVDHPAGTGVLIDRHGNVLSYTHPVAPISAYAPGKGELRSRLLETDSTYYSFDNPANKNGFSNIDLTFRRPAGARRAKLLIHGKNSNWSGYVFHQFLGLFGGQFQQWRSKQEQRPREIIERWQTDQALPLLVSVQTPEGWRPIDYFATPGNTASRDMIMELDLSGISGKTLNIRLESAFQFWDLDRVRIDYSEEQALHIESSAANLVMKNDSLDNRAELLNADGRYSVLKEHDWLQLRFERSAPARGREISYFLAGTGYYHSLHQGRGPADVQSLNGFREPGAFDQYSRMKYSEVEESLASLPLNKK